MKKNLDKSSLFTINYENQIGEEANFVKEHVDLFFSSLLHLCKKDLSGVLFSQNIDFMELELLLLSDEDVKEINNEHRGKDKTTNVLSFQNYSEKELQNFKEQECYVGSIVICYNKLLQEARELNTKTTSYLYVLLTHSFLHLCGFDHITKDQAKKMQEKEELILKNIGLSEDLKPLVDNYFNS